MATKAGAGKTVNKGEGSEFYAFLYINKLSKLLFNLLKNIIITC